MVADPNVGNDRNLREADRLAGGAASEGVSHELAFAGVNTRTHGSVGLTKPFPVVIVDFLLTRLADNWLTRWANDAL
jgi:hypothetical protein